MCVFFSNGGRKRRLGEYRRGGGGGGGRGRVVADGQNLHQSGGASSPPLIKLTEDGRRERDAT